MTGGMIEFFPSEASAYIAAVMTPAMMINPSSVDRRESACIMGLRLRCP